MSGLDTIKDKLKYDLKKIMIEAGCSIHTTDFRMVESSVDISMDDAYNLGVIDAGVCIS